MSKPPVGRSAAQKSEEPKAEKPKPLPTVADQVAVTLSDQRTHGAESAVNDAISDDAEEAELLEALARICVEERGFDPDQWWHGRLRWTYHVEEARIFVRMFNTLVQKVL